MNMGEEVSHLKAHVNTFYNNGALQRASEQPHLKTNQKPSQINKKVGSQGQDMTLCRAGGWADEGACRRSGCSGSAIRDRALRRRLVAGHSAVWWFRVLSGCDLL
ncbi:hypothetical protein [Ruegeria sp.]|uniref:hypothetical protein n=1 Tax=Ruegeria sp. TaxID=1879320 RepID=UPI003B004216